MRADRGPSDLATFMSLVLDGPVVRASFGFPLDATPVLALVGAAVAPLASE